MFFSKRVFSALSRSSRCFGESFSGLSSLFIKYAQAPSESELCFISTFIIETPSPPGSVALFPQGFAFYVSHHRSLHFILQPFKRRRGAGCSVWLDVACCIRASCGPQNISAKCYSSNDRCDAVEARFRWCDILTLGLRSSSSRLIAPSRMRNNKSILHAKADDAAEDQKERDDQRPLVCAFEAQCHTSNENKTSDGGRGRASSIGVDVWKSSQKWSVQWSAVRSIAWLGLWR